MSWSCFRTDDDVRDGLSSHRDPIGDDHCDDDHYWCCLNCSLTTGTVLEGRQKTFLLVKKENDILPSPKR